MKTFNYISRPSAYDTARALANRDDAIQGSRTIEIPEMTYPHLLLNKHRYGHF